MVEPPLIVPYLISVCLARSSADSMGDFRRSVVRNEVKFAVYEEIIISVKNHQVPLTIRVDAARGPISQPENIVIIVVIRHRQHYHHQSILIISVLNANLRHLAGHLNLHGLKPHRLTLVSKTQCQRKYQQTWTSELMSLSNFVRSILHQAQSNHAVPHCVFQCCVTTNGIRMQND